MLRTLLSVVTVVLLAAVAFLLYANFAAPTKKTNAEQEWTGVSAPPSPILPVSPPKAAPAAPAPSTVPIVEAPPLKEPLNPVIREAPKGRRTHIVRAGDSLSSISQLYFGVPAHYQKIAEINGLRQQDLIRIGQALYLPDIPMTSVTEKPRNVVSRQNNVEVEAENFEPMPPTLSATVSRQNAATPK